MVIPRSRSSSMESSTCACISRSARPPHSWMKRSARVDLPWSTCAMMEKLRICRMLLLRSAACCRTLQSVRRRRGLYREDRGLPNAVRRLVAAGLRRLLQQPPKFRGVEAVAADDRAVQQQHGYVEPVAAPELWIGIDVERFERWQRHAAREDPELGEHLLAQRTVAPVHESQTHRRHAVPASG